MRSEDTGTSIRGLIAAASCAAAVIVACNAALAEDPATGLEASVGVTSDYMLRGYTQTKGQPAVQAGLDYALGADWSVGAWTSNVDFTDPGTPDDGARVEIDLYVARAWTLSERLALDATLVRYAYPGTAPGVSYDYNELMLALHVSDLVTATVVYSNDAYATGRSAMLYEVSARHPLPCGLELSARIGQYDLERAFGSAYAYYGVGVAKAFGRFELSGHYDGADAAGRRLWGEDAAGRFVLTLSAAF